MRNPAEALLVPCGRRLFVPGMGMMTVPTQMRRHVSGIARGDREAAEIGHYFGRETKPDKPLMVVGPDGKVPILIIGDGVTEAAELQDLAVEAIAVQKDRIAAGGRGFDFDSAREKAGRARAEDFGKLASDAVQQRIAHHKANPVTDPPRRPWQPEENFRSYPV